MPEGPTGALTPGGEGQVEKEAAGVEEAGGAGQQAAPWESTPRGRGARSRPPHVPWTPEQGFRGAAWLLAPALLMLQAPISRLPRAPLGQALSSHSHMRREGGKETERLSAGGQATLPLLSPSSALGLSPFRQGSLQKSPSPQPW